jgi:hypothetical protein
MVYVCKSIKNELQSMRIPARPYFDHKANLTGNTPGFLSA